MGPFADVRALALRLLSRDRPGAAATTDAVARTVPGSSPPPDPDARFRPGGGVPHLRLGRMHCPGRERGPRSASRRATTPGDFVRCDKNGSQRVRSAGRCFAAQAATADLPGISWPTARELAVGARPPGRRRLAQGQGSGRVVQRDRECRNWGGPAPVTGAAARAASRGSSSSASSTLGWVRTRARPARLARCATARRRRRRSRPLRSPRRRPCRRDA